MAQEGPKNQTSRRGYVYVLSNPAMPGIVKIGMSTVGGKSRAQQLYGTGVPAPFVLEFEIMAEYPEELEAAAHYELGHFRLNGSREFFQMDPDEAAKRVVSCWAEMRDHSVVPADFAVDDSFLHSLSSDTAELGYYVDPPNVLRTITSEITADQVIGLALKREARIKARVNNTNQQLN